MQNPYELFTIFIALKKHFTTEAYDYLKYKNKINISEEKFKARSDCKQFVKLASMLPVEICIDFLISQFVYNRNCNVSAIISNPRTAQVLYNKYKEHQKNIFGNLQADIRTIAKKTDYSWRNAFTQSDADYPLLFKLALSEQITYESYSLMNDLFNHTERVTESLKDDLLYNTLNLKFKKYRSFLKPTTKEILKYVPKDLTILKEQSS